MTTPTRIYRVTLAGAHHLVRAVSPARAPEHCADCDLPNGCREHCRCPPTAPTARGCHECAWGKVAGCWRCGSR